MVVDDVEDHKMGRREEFTMSASPGLPALHHKMMESCFHLKSPRFLGSSKWKEITSNQSKL